MRLDQALDQRRRRALARAETLADSLGDSRDLPKQVELEEALSDVERYSRLADQVRVQVRESVDWGSPYRPGSPHSLFRDLAVQARLMGPRGGERDRLAEHQRRTRTVSGMERRDTSSDDMGAVVGTGFLPGVAAARTARPLLDALLEGGASYPLPARGMQVSLPVTVTGTVASSQSGQNTALDESATAVETRQFPVSAVAARVDVSRQALDRGGAGIDAWLGREVVQAVEAEQERQLIAGTGTNGEGTGILSETTSLVGFVTCTATTGAGQASCTLQAARVGAEARRTPSTVVAATPTRTLHWANDANGDHPNAVLRAADRGRFRLVETFGIPTNLGSSTNEDRIITLSPADLAYAEDPLVQIGGLSLAGQLSVQVIAHRYCAWTPTHAGVIQTVSGSGLAAPSAFTP